MIKARASGLKVYLYFMKKGRQARHCIPRNSCVNNGTENVDCGRAEFSSVQNLFVNNGTEKVDCGRAEFSSVQNLFVNNGTEKVDCEIAELSSPGNLFVCIGAEVVNFSRALKQKSL